MPAKLLCTRRSLRYPAGADERAAAGELVHSDFPLLVFHVRMEVRRLGLDASNLAEDAMWDSLVG